ncbi:glycerate kinase type-2 family protein [Haloarchaeobius sp. TZWWS8]|uniref:glycerate kinase type-2 family protein n=1 Tax=Haloarchaeobius sp. TZWWS8 TaxID=3446121 RepID=UPI003EBED858
MTGDRTAIDEDSGSAPRATAVARDCLLAGIEAGYPQTVVAQSCSLEGSTLTISGQGYNLDAYDEVVVLGGGNAAGMLAAALEDLLGDWLTGGLVVTDVPAETDRVEVREGDHPLPSERNRTATDDILALACGLTADTLVLAPVTGGGSALLCLPVEPVSLSDLRELTDALLRSGADVNELNTVRRALDRIKGGGLVEAAQPADVVGLVLSDVVGDDLSVVASGPTAPTTVDPNAVRDVLDRYGIDVSAAVETALDAAAARPRDSPPEPLANHLLASNDTALDAAADRAEAAEYTPLVLSAGIEGEARELAKMHVAIAEECRRSGRPASPPVALLSGGEATVTVTGDGTGGPNQEFSLAAALRLDEPGITVGSVDTDGRDGATAVAGAVVDSESIPADDRTSARRQLANNDAQPALAAADALVETGDTGTNLNDLRVVLVDRPR